MVKKTEEEVLKELISGLEELRSRIENHRFPKSKKKPPMIVNGKDWFNLNSAINHIEMKINQLQNGKRMADFLFQFLEEPMKNLIADEMESKFRKKD